MAILPFAMKKLVLGNWKMNGSLAKNTELLTALLPKLTQTCDVAICVPFPYLAQVSVMVRGSFLGVGAQNVSEHESGAHTGEVSGAMLKEMGCQYVIVGHSERRALHGETNAQVAGKFSAAQKAGLTPILCVGETLKERESGATFKVIGEQLAPLEAVFADGNFSPFVFAYEPVWAIGTGQAATALQAQETHHFIRQTLQSKGIKNPREVRIIYGGSVNASNAAEYFAQKDIDGALVGGASLKAADFSSICAAAAASN